MTLDGPHLHAPRITHANLSAALQSASFLSSVGGVAFDGVATGERGLRVVALRYNAARPDGQRLEVTVQAEGSSPQAVTAAIYDWQLVPIARFADSQTFQCFTLFGRLQDQNDEQVRRARGEELLNYHSAFADTLLGLRLMQADLLIIRPDACDLPKENGSYYLGAGETAPDVRLNQKRLYTCQHGFGGSRFSSYVICDHGQSVVFAARNGALELTGAPYWYCWRYKIDDRQKLREAQMAINREAEQIVRQQPRNQGDTQEDLQRRFDLLVDRLRTERLFEALPEYSRQVSAAVQAAEGVNPAVYRALANTMRYASFFRHAKKAQPEQWQAFVASLRGVRLDPAVHTPTAMQGHMRR